MNDILKCLKTIQECLNNLNSNSCNEIKNKCKEKLKLKPTFNKENKNELVKSIYKILESIYEKKEEEIKKKINNHNIDIKEKIEYLNILTNIYIKMFESFMEIELKKETELKENIKSETKMNP